MSKRLVSSKMTINIFGGYIVILIVSMALYYALPERGNMGDNSVIDSTNALFQEEGDYVYSQAYAGKFDEISPDFLKNSWSLPYDHDTLTIDRMTSQPVPWLVVIKQKETKDGTIDIVHYGTPYRVNGMDISEDFEGLDVHIDNKDLVISQRSPGDLTYAQFTKSIVLLQFKGEDREKYWDSEYSYSGIQVLYLEVPKDLEVTKPFDAVRFLD